MTHKRNTHEKQTKIIKWIEKIRTKDRRHPRESNMFNLLRRSRRGKTHKIGSDEEKEDNAERYSQVEGRAPSSSTSLRQENGERARRAVIEELEDFESDNDDGDCHGDSNEERLKLAKTAANGRSSDDLYINNMGGDARTPIRPSLRGLSQNEAATANTVGGQLIGTSPRQQPNGGPNEPHKRHSLLSIGNLTKTLSSADPPEEQSQSKKRKTLQKSRDFLSDIFMARGRNHQRQKQHQHQQQQHQNFTGKTKSPKYNAKDVITAAAVHLETNSDPALASPNSYQMTLANNSPTNLEEKIQRDRREPRSNSAGATVAEKMVFPQSNPENQSDPISPRSIRARSMSAPRDGGAGPVGGVKNLIQAASVERKTAAPGDATASSQQHHQQHLAAHEQHQPPEQQHQQQQQHLSDITMGQTSAKPNEISSGSAHSSRASTPREFRESIINSNPPPQAPPRHQKSPEVPKITVEDCSFHDEDTEVPHKFHSTENKPTSFYQKQETPHEIFYETEKNETPDHRSREIFYELNSSPKNGQTTLNIEELNEAHIETLEDEVFASEIPATIYQNCNNRPWTRLSHTKLENVQEEAEEEEEDQDLDEIDEAVDLDFEHPRMNGISRQSASSERSALKSDSNLSSSYADSGIGEQELSPAPPAATQPPQPPPRSSSHHVNHLSHHTSHLNSNLSMNLNHTSRGNSTDCEETLLQCDELDEFSDFSERLVCIESISLPDVVVESTTSEKSPSMPAAAAGQGTSATANGDSQININIANGAGGNSLGNVHFIPIHIEGGSSTRSRSHSRSSSPNKPRSRDDLDMPPSIEIVEDGCILNKPVRQESPFDNQELRKELKQQKVRFSSQLDEAHKNVNQLEAKVGDMQGKIQKLEQELSLKQWNVERLQSELSAAHKDDEYVRKKLKLLEDEKVHLRHKYSEDQDDLQRKYDELEAQYNELTEKYKQTQALASSLQTQLACAQVDAEEWRQQVDRIRAELEDQIRILKNALENSEAERKICENKWQEEFEMLRTHNREREESLMTDCEWQLRQMQRQCKDKMDKSNYERKQATAKAEELEQELQSRRKESEHLRVCQAQVNSLRGVVSEQEQSIQTLMDRIENLKGDLETANENLEAQIEAVHKIKYQCDNAIYDKERQMIYKIDEVRNEAAAFWENKLYTEMTRLTNELESVYVDERRDALDKLQNEHIEELRALTNRYTANEEELRAEIEELHENLELKKQDFLDLRERSDNALLQTRMHLDRADREYQNAMCREEDRRVDLEENLKKEFEAEKAEMEDKFRERLGQVKEEFAKELQLSTQDMVDTHRKELDSQKAKLQAEKDEALQELVERHRAKMAAADERINDVELRHQRNLKDLKAAYDAEKQALDKRDISNANEIEQLHRKCRCLTNLFEEMRMRYERRDPRPEDLREISELRTRCDSQERDLYVLTDRLREMQIQMSELQQNGDRNVGGKSVKKPPPKTIATSCDVIYEENEERESPEQENGVNGEEEEEEEEVEQEPSDTESNHTIEVNGKSDRINEDEAHLITAV
ncbi:uncharacterized protein [Drosophila bipectinata]|uniref:uncharacterized protein isoform X1 n=2 Tax=Drosophila bipectinata TaxID=42026 RepID=UPI0038B2D140